MKIYKKTGSKERLFEMMERVNKIDVNEYMGTNNLNSKNVLNLAFSELASKKLEVKQSNTQTNGDNTFVELLCLDNNGNNITFVFKSSASEGEQDGVYNVNEVILSSFSFDDVSSGESVDLDENNLNEFNSKYGDKLFDVIDDYLDYESSEPEIDEEYENAIRKIDSYKEQKSPIDNLPENKRKIIMKAYDNLTTKKGRKDYAPSAFEINDEIKRMKTAGNDNINEITYADDTNIANIGTTKQISKLDQRQKDYIIRAALNNVNEKLQSFGMSYKDFSKEEFTQRIKDEAIKLFQQYLSTGNYDAYGGSSLNEKKEENSYPDPIGQKFKSKSNYPKPKKKPTKTVSIGEDVAQNDDNNEPEVEIGEPEINNLEKEKEESGDILNGGLGDDKSPEQFDTEQIVKGLKVEMEHTNDPMIAMEIVIDHLTEIPDYYTRLEKMENDAEINDDDITDSDKSEKEMEDILLGYEPKNVGDEVDEELTDYQKDLISDLPDITTMDVPVGLGKTGTMNKPKEK